MQISVVFQTILHRWLFNVFDQQDHDVISFTVIIQKRSIYKMYFAVVPESYSTKINIQKIIDLITSKS